MDPFFGRALAGLDMAFFPTFVLLSGCVLEETHGINNFEVEREAVLNAEHKLLY